MISSGMVREKEYQPQTQRLNAVLGIVWVAEPKLSACSVKHTGHWPLVIWNDLNLFTDNPMRVSRFEQVYW